MSVATEITRLKTAKADIKTAIEGKGVIVGDGTIDTYAEKIAGIPSGGQGSFDEGYEEGMKAQYDAFWDAFQDNGDRTDYNYAFYGTGDGWNSETLKPKHDLIPISAVCMFKSNASIKENISEFFKKQGKKLDFSNCANLNETFSQPGVVGVGTLDTRSCNNIGMVFTWNSKITEVKEFILRNDGSQVIDGSCFKGATNLKTLIVTGCIGCNFIANLSYLDKVSITSIVNALSDTVGATLTLRKQAVINAFGSENSAEWTNLISFKSNQYSGLWTISLT